VEGATCARNHSAKSGTDRTLRGRVALVASAKVLSTLVTFRRAAYQTKRQNATMAARLRGRPARELTSAINQYCPC
jgi:hypothetical protein